MLARQFLRAASKPRFTTAFRSASTISASSIEAMNTYGIGISKAQGVAKNGLVSGTSWNPAVAVWLKTLTDTTVLPQQQSVTHP
jgi:cysteine synthase